jgi:phytoene synthase
MYALYAFARTTDDLGDCNQSRALRTHWLQLWREAAELNLMDEDSKDRQIRLPNGLFVEGSEHARKRWPIDLRQRSREIIPALRDTARRYQVPTRHLLEIIDGVIADQRKTRFDTYEQLEHFSTLAASSVGLACIHIWGFRDPLPTAAALDCGMAFQLTNILRDVREDARRGRIYLPRQHYEQHGLSEDDLLRPRPDDRLRCLVVDEAERAKQLFESGWHVWDSLHPDGRPMFSMIWRTYRRLLDRIIEDPRAVAEKRIRLSRREKVGLRMGHFIGPLFRQLPVPPVELNR